MQDHDFLSVDGVRLEYRSIPARTTGTPTLVFLHEGLGSVGLWRDFPEQVSAATGLGAFIYSRRGYGGSDACDLPRPIDYMEREATDVLPVLLSEAAIEDVILIGHSDGASIATVHAARAANPGLRGIVLMAPHFFVELISVDSIRKAGRAYREGELRARLERHHGRNVDCAFFGWHDSWINPDFFHWSIRDDLPAIRVPTLLIQGVGDEYGTLEQVDAAEKGISAPLTVRVLDDCGHSPQRDQPQATISAIREFVAGLAQSRDNALYSRRERNAGTE